MTATKIPADIVTKEEMEHLRDLDERQTRHFLAVIANRLGWQGVGMVCSVCNISRNTVYRGRREQISKVWSGAVFNTIEEACELASRARTKTGLAVFTSINRRIYETKTERNPLFESECKRHIVKDEILPKWNYLVKCN